MTTVIRGLPAHAERHLRPFWANLEDLGYGD